MISLMFEKLGERQLVVIDGTQLLFGDTSSGAFLADIKGLKLNYEGVILEHPDLAGKEDWQEQAVIRLTGKLNSFNSEEERAEYVINDLRNKGFRPLFKQKKGFRTESIK